MRHLNTKIQCKWMLAHTLGCDLKLFFMDCDENLFTQLMSKHTINDDISFYDFEQQQQDVKLLEKETKFLSYK